MTRREFLRFTGAAVALAACPVAFGEPDEPLIEFQIHKEPPFDIVYNGTRLMLAHYIYGFGDDPVLVEVDYMAAQMDKESGAVHCYTRIRHYHDKPMRVKFQHYGKDLGSQVIPAGEWQTVYMNNGISFPKPDPFPATLDLSNIPFFA
jgi:hypothetical protein